MHFYFAESAALAAKRRRRIAEPLKMSRATILRVRRVSRRPEGDDVLRDAAAMQRTMNRLRGALIPRGVYRFADHEEADRWMIRTIANTHAHLSSKTSSRSASTCWSMRRWKMCSASSGLSPACPTTPSRSSLTAKSRSIGWSGSRTRPALNPLGFSQSRVT